MVKQGATVPKCIHLDFSGTHWKNEDIGKKISVPWKCTGMKRSKEYYVIAYSLPLPNVGGAKTADIFVTLPPQRKSSRKVKSQDEVLQTAKQDHSTSNFPSLNSVASTSPTKQDKTTTVAVTVSVAGTILFGLILVAVVIITKKRTSEGLHTKSNGIDVAVDNNVEGKSFKSGPVVAPDTASSFSNLGSEHMKRINDWQSLASKEVSSQNELDNAKEYYYYNLDAKAYPV